MRQFIHKCDDIITVKKLLLAWREFLHDKRDRKDVILFQAKLIDNIFSLHNDLKNRTYKHGGYKAFNISDPKPRIIHKATVRDRVLHHLIYKELYPYFDTKFIFDSYSCRNQKGTHKAINRFRSMAWKVSKNATETVWILKGDIRKFFANIDHKILKDILSRYIKDQDILWLLGQVIDSFNTNTHLRYSVDNSARSCLAEVETTRQDLVEKVAEVGLPLGNLTSQLLVNIYMNEFDQFIKRELKVRYYIRYADDFVVLSESKEELENFLPKMSEFLGKKLKLQMHPDKVYIKILASGLDFLGWVHFPKHRVLRTATKRRMFRNLTDNPKEETIVSYLGMLGHGDGFKLEGKIKEFL